jgi:DNA-directed RNA polymerase II subunit RPB1
MGLVQDVLCGIKIFTKRDTFMNRAQVMNLLLWIDNWNGELPTPAILKPEKLWTGK